MQKKLIALAVAGLMSGAAFAQTSVTIGGKVDAGYQFKRTASLDTAAGGATGGNTTETLSDGGASTSRITFGAKENLGNGMEAGVSLDMRFSDFFDGKSTTSSGVGGLTSNDKKAVYLKTPFGTMQWGVINLGDNFYLASKPYMVEPKDLEIVKYGIVTTRYTALTSRISEYYTPVINAGPVALLGKVQYAFGDNRKSGGSNVDGASSGDAYSLGLEYKVGSLVNGGFDYVYRTPSSNTTEDTYRHYRLYSSVFPIDGLKIAVAYYNMNGYGTLGTKQAGWQEKNTNLVVSYNMGGKLEVGAELSHMADVGENRNSGKGYMIGGAYFLSKSTYVYLARQKNNFESNLKSYGGKFDGTAAGFGSGSGVTKADSTYTRFGFVKEF